jgi:BirA family biotin operon repressor/biotin-[acetyl-CoA-carboxylase] ligase
MVLAALRETPGRFVSGEELAGRLGLSRTAVWKQIRRLRQEGYGIEARARAGYRLVHAPDRLYPEELEPYLKGLRLAGRVLHFDRVGSTMDVARKLAETGAEEGTLVIAETQEAGRGRLGRAWASAHGLGLWFSLVLRPRLLPAQVAKTTLLAAVAMAEAVQQVTGLGPGIKWPNDLYLGGRKVCGILTELKGQADAVEYLVLGVGVNVNQREEDFPPELRRQATSLLLVGGGRVERTALLASFLREFEARYRPWQEAGREDWLEEWRRRNITLGRNVKITQLEESFFGRAVALDGDGSLVVEGEDGRRRVFRAGDVSLL